MRIHSNLGEAYMYEPDKGARFSQFITVAFLDQLTAWPD